jgi:hypothetical protein
MLSTAVAVSVKTRGELNDAIHARPPQRPFRLAFILTTRTCAAARNDCVSYNHVIKEDTIDAYATATTTGGTAIEETDRLIASDKVVGNGRL